MSDSLKYWVVIPAAGEGLRMGVDKPKQYISINNKTIIEHTIDCFIYREEIEKIIVAISKEDEFWSTLEISDHDKIMTVSGGKERYQSVLNSLKMLSSEAEDDDWVMVHDAARPCLNQSAIDRLIIQLKGHDIGGILAMPCRDTMKRSNDTGEIDETVERQSLWHAQTPQMFKYGKLLLAIQDALKNKAVVTDEAMAVERLGFKPMLVLGHQGNIKLTYKDDLESLRLYLDRII
ncbi:MAG: 2-C-methyl-D-erythritol 4-phosphate cytidylyltransferase [Legionellales bacterium]|nr:2-C-methyl-D-erythritol 4-phosphate cytidylyltransferase [Legionellales bacterium]|tara:strand:- start:485 stop:1186 length:702 start_codon:yes stop_codon:yes gene_type:complete